MSAVLHHRRARRIALFVEFAGYLLGKGDRQYDRPMSLAITAVRSRRFDAGEQLTGENVERRTWLEPLRSAPDVPGRCSRKRDLIGRTMPRQDSTLSADIWSAGMR